MRWVGEYKVPMMNVLHYQELNDFDLCDMTECVYEVRRLPFCVASMSITYIYIIFVIHSAYVLHI